AGPWSPPRSRAARESTRSPPRPFDFGPWHSKQRSTRTGRTRFSKNSRALGSFARVIGADRPSRQPRTARQREGNLMVRTVSVEWAHDGSSHDYTRFRRECPTGSRGTQEEQRHGGKRNGPSESISESPWVVKRRGWASRSATGGLDWLALQYSEAILREGGRRRLLAVGRIGELGRGRQ